MELFNWNIKGKGIYDYIHHTFKTLFEINSPIDVDLNAQKEFIFQTYSFVNQDVLEDIINAEGRAICHLMQLYRKRI